MSDKLDFEQYIADALRTEKVVPVIRGDASFVPAALQVLVAAGKLADMLKKRLIYGRVIEDQQFDDVLMEVASAVQDAGDAVFDADEVELDYHPRLLHAALGGFGEQAELLEGMQSAIDDGRDLDEVHVMEEIGDQLWYAALALDAVNDVAGIQPKAVAQLNIAKLRARFPNAFTLEAVTNRDLAAERAALEGRA